MKHACIKIQVLACLLFLASNGYATSKDIAVIGLGDSVTRATNAMKLADNPTVSWATGSQIKSVAEYLKSAGFKITAMDNFAAMGRTSESLLRQLNLADRYAPGW